MTKVFSSFLTFKLRIWQIIQHPFFLVELPESRKIPLHALADADPIRLCNDPRQSVMSHINKLQILYIQLFKSLHDHVHTGHTAVRSRCLIENNCDVVFLRIINIRKLIRNRQNTVFFFFYLGKFFFFDSYIIR